MPDRTIRAMSIAVLVLSAPLQAAHFWDVTILDQPGSLGGQPSLAVLPSGEAACAYFDFNTHVLKCARFDGATWHKQDVDGSGFVANDPSLAMLPDGRPAIAYNLQLPGAVLVVRYARWDGTAWQIQDIDEGGSACLAVLPSGLPAIAYSRRHGGITYAEYDGTTFQKQSVTNTYANGFDLAILPSGRPAVSFWTGGGGNVYLKYAVFNGTAWATSTVDQLLNGSGIDMDVLGNGQPAVAYADQYFYKFKYAWLNGDTWEHAVVEAARTPAAISMAIMSTGQPAFSYNAFVDYSGRLKYAVPSADGFVHTFIDICNPNASSLAFLPDGRPMLAYATSMDNAVKIARAAAIPPSPVPMLLHYTATASTTLAGTQTIVDGPVSIAGTGAGDLTPTASGAYAAVEETDTGHLRLPIIIRGNDGRHCSRWDPILMYCITDYPISCRDASASISGTLELGTSVEFPAGRPLLLRVERRFLGAGGDAESTSVRVSRGGAEIAELTESLPGPTGAIVLAGETLSVEASIAERDARGDDHGYNRMIEHRLMLSLPCTADLDLDARVGTLDLDLWRECASGPDLPRPATPVCARSDLDADGDVDQADFGVLQRCLAGEDVSPDPACAQ